LPFLFRNKQNGIDFIQFGINPHFIGGVLKELDE
jgi:hypothetical protein